MTKRYKLLKDLPDYNAGEIFEYSEDGYYRALTYCDDGVKGAWPPKYVENNPTWFQEIKEPVRIEVTRIYDLNNVYQPQCVRTGFETSAPIPGDKFPAIKQAIEKVLNEEGKTTMGDLRNHYGIPKLSTSMTMYTQEQLNEEIGKAFYAGRYGPKSKSFQDYLSSL